MLALAGAWMLADLARQFVVTGFPWNPWGSVWAVPGAVGDVFIQPAAWVGVHGLTLATLLLAARAAAGLALARRRGGAAGRLGGVGVARLADARRRPGARACRWCWCRATSRRGRNGTGRWRCASSTRYLDLTRQAVARLPPGAPAVVVWPETASPFLLQTDAAARAAIAEAAGGAVSLVGAVRFDAAGRPRNSLFAVLAGRPASPAIYDKWHLVPFGEYIRRAGCRWPFQVVPGGGFAPGPGPTTLHVPGLPPVGPLICYEAIFTGQIVSPADRPAWLVNVTNDAWFGNSTGPRQHLAAARMRAVEEGLPLMRAANTGISGGFDARGHELARIGHRPAGDAGVGVAGCGAGHVVRPVGLWLPFRLALAVLGLGLSVAAAQRPVVAAARQIMSLLSDGPHVIRSIKF